MKYNLEQRTTKFGQNIISFARGLRVDLITQPLIRQLVRSGTSVGANYREANESSSKRDFRNKICISKKEANETKHWLKMISTACPECLEASKELWNESHELVLILATIFRNVDLNSK